MCKSGTQAEPQPKRCSAAPAEFQFSGTMATRSTSGKQHGQMAAGPLGRTKKPGKRAGRTLLNHGLPKGGRRCAGMKMLCGLGYTRRPGPARNVPDDAQSITSPSANRNKLWDLRQTRSKKKGRGKND